MVSRNIQLLLILSSLLLATRAHAQNCPDQFRQILRKLTETKNTLEKDVHFEMTQNRLTGIYPELFSLIKTTEEKHQLARTLELLGLDNNKQKLFSELEQQFRDGYFVFSKKELPTDELHTYFRSIVRGDLDQAKSTADQILSHFPKDKHELLGHRLGIHSSEDVFWKTYTSKPEVKTTIIDYFDPDVSNAKGALVDFDSSTQLGKMATGMEDIHGVKIATVPEAIKVKRANGFSTKRAAYTNLETRDGVEVESRMIVIPENNVEHNVISATTKHEARHAYYATERQLKSSSPLDTTMLAIKGKKLGKSGGYSIFQSSEELSTHSRDLTDVFRTGNREILNLYKTQSTLHTNQVIDIVAAESKSKTLRNIATQTVQNTNDALKELRILKQTPAEKIEFFQIALGPEGYELTFRVDNRFSITTYVASKPEQSLVTQYVAAYKPFQKNISEIQDKLMAKIDSKILSVGKVEPSDPKFQAALRATRKIALSQVDPVIAKNATEKLAPVLEVLEKKIGETQQVAEITEKKTKAVLDLIEGFHAGKNGTLTREEYLKVRDILIDPSSTFIGAVKKNPEETQKALEAIRKKREARKLGN